MKKNAYAKDIWRSIKKSKKRFLSILVITALGVTVLTGIYAAVQDMYYSADKFYDEQRLFDIRVLSTLGLTDEDVAALQVVPDIETAEGAYSETVHTEVDGVRQTAALTMLSAKGLNTPYVMEGALPAGPGEIAVTQGYIDASGKAIGSTIVIEEEMEEDEEEPAEEAEPQPEPEPEEPAADGDGDSLNTDIDWDADVAVEEDAETPNFLHTTYTITAVVLDPMDISSQHGTGFRANAAADYTFFVTPADVDTDVYTAVYLDLADATAMNCYSDEYEAAVQGAIDRIEGQIMEQREKARYDAIMAEALEKITDAEALMDEKFTEADGKFADAWAEISDAKKELVDGEAELTREERDALQKLADARAELEDGRRKLQEGESQLADGDRELIAGELELNANAQKLADGKQQLEAGKQELAAQRQTALDGFAAAEQQLQAAQDQLTAQRQTLDAQIPALQAVFGAAWPQAEWDAYVGQVAALTVAAGESPDDAQIAADSAAQQAALAAALTAALPPGVPADLVQQTVQAGYGLGRVQGGQQVLDAQYAAFNALKAESLAKLDAAAALLAEEEKKLLDGEKQLEEGRQKLVQGREELERNRATLADGWAELVRGEEELNREEAKALRELADAWRELAEGKQELADGEAELIENEQKYQDKKAEAEGKIADAYEELADIDMTQWYVQDRAALDSFSSMKSDMSSIEAVGNAFPVVFLVVAILISLTTMTRMVEEDRGLIGTYKAMGFKNSAIYRKYIVYALAACLLGGLLGDVLGFVALPLILSRVLTLLYTLPQFLYRFDWLYGLGGVALFTVSIVGATALTCRGELAQMPAPLMRPKAPRAGSRVFLERIPFVWNRLKFLNKVTIRNLFRYKKRLFMTVLGILGCTALVLAGFAIKDSVTDLMPRQYERIYQYDLMAVADDEDNAELLALLDGDEVTDYLNLQIGSAKVLNPAGSGESVQLMVVPDGETLDGYISLPDRDGVPAALDDTGVLLTQNAAELLGLEPGDPLTLQNLQLDQRDTVLSGVVENYLGNNVYITQTLYQSLFGDYAPNGVLAHLADTVADPAAYADSLLENDIVLSAVSTQAIKDDFATNFALINSVVYLLIVLAAGLAFVVLFTLSNTNISERIRELATTKVLGFYDKEVHAYVNKETLILTVMGVVAGLPVGRFISGLLTEALKMPSLYFAVSVHPISYVIAGVLSFSFALLVNLMTNRTLNHIDMVEALKSVE